MPVDAAVRPSREERSRMQQREVRHVAVIGTGTIGASWTAFFLARGLRVSASDPSPQAEAQLHQFVDAAWPVLRELWAGPAAPPYEALVFHADPEAAVAEADFVQENSPPPQPVKHALPAPIDAVLPPQGTIASTPSLPLTLPLHLGCR